MIRKAIVLLASLVAVVSLGAQTQWTKYESNPVLEVGSFGSFDDESVDTHSVLFDEGVYKMWYAGNRNHTSSISGPTCSGSYLLPGERGYATSVDGLNWTKHESNPILTTGVLGRIYVLKHASLYKMWYDCPAGIGYATSADGISWTLNPNPVLTPGPSASWDEHGTLVGTVSIVNESTYRMWYVGGSRVNNHWPVGYALSTDGINWNKYEDNPIFDDGKKDDLDRFILGAPDVVFDGESYHMFYEESDFSLLRLLYATSPDGIVWTKRLPNPLIQVGSFGSFDATQASHGRVTFDDQTFKLWYAGRSSFGLGQIGFASAPMDAVTTVSTNDVVPGKFALAQNYPNPFNPSTVIHFTLSVPGQVTLRVFNLVGQEVATLVDNHLPAGDFETTWKAWSSASGIYLYRLQTGENIITRKMLLTK